MTIRNHKLAVSKLLAMVGMFSFILFSLLLISQPADAATTGTCLAGTNYGTDTIGITVPTTGTYEIWVRLQTPNAATVNSIMMQVDSSSCYSLGGSSSMPANSWTWINYQDGNTSSVAEVTLAQGAHNLEFIGNEAGMEFDRVELLMDTTCVPSSTGDNCTPPIDTPPSIAITAPTTNATVSGTAVSIAANVTDNQTITQVQFQIDGKVIATDTSSPYTYNWNSTTVTDGTHTLTAIATDSANLSSTATETINVANHTCSSAPDAPPSFSGTSSSPTNINLNWGASVAATGCSITGYIVDQNGAQISSTTGTSVNVNNLSPNTKYNFSVVATDNDGHTSAASSTTVTTQADTTPPSAPTNVTAKAINSAEVDLNWTASTDNIAVAYYRIIRNGSLLTTVKYPATSYSDTTVSGNTAYEYQVAAVDTSNNVSAYTDAQPYPVTTPKYISQAPPSAPSNLSSPLSTSSTISLTWSASTASTGNTIVGYRVYRNNTPVTTVATTSYTDTGLSSSTTYNYFVKAIDSSGNLSTGSNNLTVTTQPGAPTMSYCLDGNSRVDFGDVVYLFARWNQPAQARFNYDNSNVVDFGDIIQLFAHWGQPC